MSHECLLPEEQRAEFTDGLPLAKFAQKHFGYWSHEVLQTLDTRGSYLFVINPEYFGESRENLATRDLYTVTSSAIFARSDRVVEGEPILSPTSYLQQRGLTPLVTTSLIPDYLQSVRDSMSIRAVWGGTALLEEFWTSMPGRVATPEKIDRFAQSMATYHRAFTHFIQSKGQDTANLYQAAEDIGLMGFWREMYGGAIPFVSPEMFFDELSSHNISFALGTIEDQNELELEIKAKMHLARKKIPEDEIELIDAAFPLAFRFHKDPPYFYLDNSLGLGISGETFGTQFPIRPIFDTVCLPGGLYPDQIDEVLVGAGAQPHLDRINVILTNWGCPKAQVVQKVNGLSDCRMAYNKMYSADFWKAVEGGGFYPLIEPEYQTWNGGGLYKWKELSAALAS